MKKVLIIEDDRWFADTVAKTFTKKGWQTRLESDGRKGIDALDDFDPDVMLLDVMLPDVTAPALLNELQSYTDLADLPIVLCTSLETAHFEPNSLKSYGVAAVLDKAKVTPDDIVEAVSRAVS